MEPSKSDSHLPHISQRIHGPAGLTCHLPPATCQLPTASRQPFLPGSRCLVIRNIKSSQDILSSVLFFTTSQIILHVWSIHDAPTSQPAHSESSSLRHSSLGHVHLSAGQFAAQKSLITLCIVMMASFRCIRFISLDNIPFPHNTVC